MATSATSTFAGLKLEFAPGVGAKTAPTGGQWIDITSRLRSFTIGRGSPTSDSGFPAGTMTVVLDNTDRQLDPDYSAGTYFGDLLPYVQIRLTATFGATTEEQFTGFVEAWPQSYPGQDADSLVTLLAADAFELFANTKLPGSVYEYTIRTAGPSSWFRMSEKSGTIAGDTSGNGKHGTYNATIVAAQQAIVPYAGPDDGSLEFDGIDDYVSAPASVFSTADTTYSVEFWLKTDQVPTGGGDGVVLVKTIAAGSPAGSFIVKMFTDGTIHTNGPKASTVAVNDNKVHHVVVSRAANVDTIYVDSLDVTTTLGSITYYTIGDGTWIGSTPSAAIADVIEEPFRGFLDEVSFWDTALSSTNVSDHYAAGTAPWSGQTSGVRIGAVLDAIGWPSSQRDLDVGASALGPAVLGGTALEHMQTVEKTEAGWLFMTGDGLVRLVGRGNRLSESTYSTSQATFGDGGGSEMKYYDITLEPGHIRDIVNTARVSRQGGVEQIYTDDTSADQYGDRDKSLTGLLMASEVEAHDRAYFEVLLRKDPQSRVSELVVKPGRDATNLYSKVLAYDIGTRLTAKRRPQAIGSAISKDIHISGVKHEGNAGQMGWSTTWSTTAVDPNETTWFVFNSATQGKFNTNVFSY